MNLIHTYSVVLADPPTGRLGVAVQSHWFNVGRIVPWVRAGVGAVATQSVADPTYGPRGLDLMESGSTAGEALQSLIATDPERDLRQVAFVDTRGNVEAHTGSRCIRHASHLTGPGWSVQANMMRNESVVPAMAEAVATTGEILERLVHTLEAAERAGGDLRGSQSAALLVTGDGPVPDVDLHVEDHPDPISELRRLSSVHRAYEHMGRGDDALAAGDTAQAMSEYSAAAAASANAEVLFWKALTMASVGRQAEAVDVMRQALTANRDLSELLRRLPEVQLVDAATAASLLAALD